MSFIWPLMLLLLLLLPLLVARYLQLQQRRQRLAASHGSLGFAREGARRRLGRQRHVPPALFLVALGFLLVAIARPQAVISLPTVVGTVILAFDVSGSMAADDMRPTRMEVAKEAAREFVRRQPSTVQIGVVAFSDAGLAVQAPTNDQGLILAAINRLAPARGTSLANGILASLSTLDAADDRRDTRYYTNLTPAPTATAAPRQARADAPAAIVLLTDGENTVPPNPLAAAQVAADRGVRVYTIGIGSSAGAPLRIDGFTIQSRLDEATLQQIAQRTDGAYFNAGDEDELRAVYGSLGSQLVVRPELTELTAIFSGAGLLVLLLGGLCSLLWFGRLP